jgi:hypothetical protein
MEMHHGSRAALVAALLTTLCAGTAQRARAETPPAGSQPLVLDKTATIRAEGGSYYIDGPCVIPRDVEITVQLGVTIVGINGASLDVQGGLKVHGTEGRWVTIRNVDFSPTRFPLRGLHLDMADLEGCTFRHTDAPDGGELGGLITIENSCLQRTCVFDVKLTRGFLKLMTVEFGMPCRIRSVRQKENPVPIEVEVRSSWMAAIDFSGPATANFRHSELKGGLTCRNVTEVMVDGCDVLNQVAVLQVEEESFRDISVTKCNFFDGAKLILQRPEGPKAKKERVKVDKCYFGGRDTGVGVTDLEEIAKRIVDGEDVEGGGTVRAWVPKTQKRRHSLVSYDLRGRAPPLR